MQERVKRASKKGKGTFRKADRAAPSRESAQTHYFCGPFATMSAMQS